MISTYHDTSSCPGTKVQGPEKTVSDANRALHRGGAL